jgi:hypothetical protein
LIDQGEALVAPYRVHVSFVQYLGISPSLRATPINRFLSTIPNMQRSRWTPSRELVSRLAPFIHREISKPLEPCDFRYEIDFPLDEDDPQIGQLRLQIDRITYQFEFDVAFMSERRRSADDRIGLLVRSVLERKPAEIAVSEMNYIAYDPQAEIIRIWSQAPGRPQLGGEIVFPTCKEFVGALVEIMRITGLP